MPENDQRSVALAASAGQGAIAEVQNIRFRRSHQPSGPSVVESTKSAPKTEAHYASLDPIRQRIELLAADHDRSLAWLSYLIGKDETYLLLYGDEGSPETLPPFDRRRAKGRRSKERWQLS